MAAFPDFLHEGPGRSAILERQCYQYNSREKIMTNTVEATEKDFQQMIQMLTGFAVTQIIGAAAAYKIAARPPAREEQPDQHSFVGDGGSGRVMN